MIAFILLILIMLVSTYLFLRWFTFTPPQNIRRGVKRFGLLIIVLFFVLLAATGRLHWAVVAVASVLGALIPLAQRLLPLLIQFAPFLHRIYRQHQARKQARPHAQSGNKSEVDSRFLKMTLDHDTGIMSGEIVSGPETGKTLDSLPLERLLNLVKYYRHEDSDSAQLLEAYLDRHHGAAWREHEEEERQTHTSGEMTQAEALSILGFDDRNNTELPNREEIIERHRQLMLKLHPDRHGSTYLAAQVNRAKEVLLQANAR